MSLLPVISRSLALARRLCARYLFPALLGVCLAACASSSLPTVYPTYNPFLPLSEAGEPRDSATLPTRTPGATPTRAPLSVTLPGIDLDTVWPTPTPDAPRRLPTPRREANQYVVQPGDVLGDIARRYGVSLEALKQANSIHDENRISAGQTLLIPPPEAGPPGPAFKIIPDSELVYGPASALFDLEAFIQEQGGYLASYTQQMDGESLSGAEILARVARNYSVNPRLLLAILEYRSHWVTRADPDPATLDYPLGFVVPDQPGLYRQLTWAADELNRGYYLWRVGAVGAWVLGDGNIVPIDPTLNAGTAGVQNMLSKLNTRPAWDADVSETGLFQTYSLLFGNPFRFALEPLLPPSLSQPRLDLPFEPGTIWAFTGGPHAAWDSGSAWAALDFAPADTEGCSPSAAWVLAVADGFIVRAANGAVVQDLDGDGYEQTGWNVLYMHIAVQDRIPPGTYAYAGDPIGHPSCEGGIANAAHLHLARKYNGEWIPADGPLPFVLGGWVSSGTGVPYNGYLKRGGIVLEAAEGFSPLNQISR